MEGERDPLFTSNISSRPSMLSSKSATPPPVVSIRYLLLVGEFCCTKSMPCVTHFKDTERGSSGHQDRQQKSHHLLLSANGPTSLW
jgi:hypothetical protein